MRARDPGDASPAFSLAIGRALGTVVVTLHGELDGTDGESLGILLIDLVEGQGNSVVVDMRDLRVVTADASRAFRVVGDRARERGSLFFLSEPSSDVDSILMEAGLCDMVTRRSDSWFPAA